MEGEALTAARALLPLIATLREETETGRRLPSGLVAALRGAGLCRRAMPPLEALEVYETLAGAEASVAWIVWNNALPCFFGRFLTPESRAEIFGNVDWLFASST